MSLACYFIPQYVIGTYLWAKVSLAAGAVATFPVSAEGLMQLVVALLGMSTLRTYEKITKVSK